MANTCNRGIVIKVVKDAVVWPLSTSLHKLRWGEKSSIVVKVKRVKEKRKQEKRSVTKE